MTSGRWLAGFGLLALLAAGCRIEPGAFDDDDLSQNSDGELHYRWTESGSQLDVRAKGQLTFNADYTDLVDLAADGSFSIEESFDGGVRKFELRHGENGDLQHVYSVDGKPRDANDPTLHAWLGETLPRVLRETGFDAPNRVRRLRERGGVIAVLDEISKIESGTSRTVYIEELIESGPLQDRELSLALKATDEIYSSVELGRILQRLTEEDPANSRFTLELIEQSRRLQSSGERRRLIERIVEERDLDGEAAKALARSAAEMRSDSELAQAILRVAERSPRDAETAKAFFEAAGSIRSSSEKSRVFRELLGKPGLDDSMLAAAARGIAGIDSSSEKALALVKLGEVLRPDGKEAPTAFFEAVASIESVGERERVISAFVARGDLKSTTLRRSLDFVKSSLPDGPLRQRLVEKIERKLSEE